MGKKRLTLHIQQNTTLVRVAAIIEVVNSPNPDIDILEDICNLKSSVLQKNVFPFLRSLAILDTNNPPKLTELGEIAVKIKQLNHDLLGDFFHLIIYCLHLERPDRRFSWAYATLAQKLWLRKEVVLSPAEKKALVGEVMETAAQNFELSTSEIAFSDSSIAGVLNWLRALTPKVIESEGKAELFTRRYFCTAPIFVKAVDSIYQQQQQTYGVKIFLREKVKDTICQMLLLDPTGLDGTLDNAKRTYDYDQGGFFDYGYEGGYGQWLMLTQSPEWEELL
ncbi:MAG: hypothetical protein F6K21_05150 [Symploca sp. SIO2D2]|nr:hypothetical protein [Symploca sp. SIO2D2]